MDKKYFNERLKRWPHLHFSEVIIREYPGTPTWNKKYEIYLQDQARLSAQLFICTTSNDENPEQIAEQYRNWLEEYNQMAAGNPLAAQENMSHQAKRFCRSPSARSYF